MTNLQQRQNEIKSKVATAAYKLPLMSSGFLFHQDVRDNFYYASYLFAASQEQDIPFEGDRHSAKEKAESILLLLLELQDRNAKSPTYGHWPLNLRPTPHEATKNTLPVELMGSLMVYFYERYADVLSESLRNSFEGTLFHIYESGFYRKRVEHFNHHEAKYTAAKLIFGQRYEDKDLLEDGIVSLRRTLDRVTTLGMSEYGGLPWFWHWVQAFTCAWQLMKDPEIKGELARLLDYLWRVRSTYYLGGAWVGPHSRIWPHDMPRDTNVLHDYAQYGDFTLPDSMPRTEYAGFLAYEAPVDARHLALNRQVPVEVKSRIPKQAGLAINEEDVLHSYVFITESFAVGGIYERVLEFDNEQHRWDVALPLDRAEGVNHAYFFHPAPGNGEGDLRHQSEYSEVFFHRSTVIADYQIPENIPNQIIGCLPAGDWVEDKHALFGLCGDVYMAVYVQQPHQREVLADRSVITSSGNKNAVVFECMDTKDAKSRGIADLRKFADVMRNKQPAYSPAAGNDYAIHYTTLNDDLLVFKSGPNSEASRFVNGHAADFTDYKVLLK
ncbi:hypothetical protein [Paenibacillus aceris]|uniref:DUF2264 domain-containing protein n=1 Tax=Paenibacillus aceris TaxID=869555 RepID=A0ABS4HU94_9BACL|nr:hypothetical protein [Paenibacillus aceris]MBP1962178.1 hypothetical protein [Paenibacillus aceris]NHW33975.1 hypothetical protein [Paenibacillus aceris]